MRVSSAIGTSVVVDRAGPHALERERLRRLLVGALQALRATCGACAASESSAYIARVVAALPGLREGRRPCASRRARGARRPTTPRQQREHGGRGERGEAAGVGDRVSTAGRGGSTALTVRRSPVRSDDVTGIDWLIVGVVVLLGLFGWAQGFVAGALALVGFAVGAWVGTRIGPLLLDDGRRSPWSPAFGLVGALIAGMVFAIGFEGIGARLRGRVRRRPRRRRSTGSWARS